MMQSVLFCLLVGVHPIFFLDTCMRKECAQSIQVYRLIGPSGFEYSFGCINDATRYNIQEVISLGIGLMWNYAAVCVGRMGLKILERDSSEMWKFLKSESAMMFTDPLMCWGLRYTSLLMRVQPNHRDTVLWSYSLTGSN